MSPADLEALALRSVPGGGGVAVTRTSQGLVNDIYRVERGGRVFALRVPAAAAATGHGTDRHWECRVLRAAGRAGFAPALEHCAARTGVLVADWVAGRVWSAGEAKGEAAVDSLARLLRGVHALRPPQPARVVSPAQWIRDYSARGGAAVDAAGRALAAEAVRRLAAVAMPSPVTVLCHGDLHRSNLVVRDAGAADGAPMLLDWEYAHVSDPLWDVGGWIANEDWDAAPARALATAYLLRAPTAAEWTRLADLAWLYDYVCVLWSRCHLRGRARASQGAVAARAELLTERLNRPAGGLAA